MFPQSQALSKSRAGGGGGGKENEAGQTVLLLGV